MVINLSNTPLDKAQKLILVQEPNFAIAPRYLLLLEYIIAIEQVFHKFIHQDLEELRTNINRVLKSSHPLKANISYSKYKAMQELKGIKVGTFSQQTKGWPW